MQTTELASMKEVLLWIIYGGSGVLVQQLLGWLDSSMAGRALLIWLRLPPFSEWVPEFKRYLSFVLDVLFAWAVFGLAVALGYMQAPIGWLAWVETLFAIGFLPIVVQQTVHARRKLSA